MQKQRPRRVLVRFARAIAACLCALYLAELGIGVFLTEQPGHFPTEMFSEDATRGIALSSGFDQWVERVRSFHVTINEQGYRDTDWHKKAPPRVLLVGSSATFGVGLEMRQGIAAQLEKGLEGKASVLNAAVYSYGPPQAQATIERECPHWAPRLILYLHEYKLTRRDFTAARRENPGAHGPDAAGAQWGSLALRHTRAFLSNHGLHPRQLAERIWGLGRLIDDYLLRHYAVTVQSELFCATCITRAVFAIEKMKRAANACGAAFRMIVLPGPAEAFYGLREPATRDVLSRLTARAPDVSVVDLRDQVPRGSRMNLAGLDYFDEQAAGWIARHILPVAQQSLATGTSVKSD